jgi:hypothetical protein
LTSGNENCFKCIPSSHNNTTTIEVCYTHLILSNLVLTTTDINEWLFFPNLDSSDKNMSDISQKNVRFFYFNFASITICKYLLTNFGTNTIRMFE